MAKYDWHNLEKEYILSDYKSVSAFLKDKNIPRNGSVQKAVKGWNEKKVQKEFEQSSKTIQKVIEKQAEQDAGQILKVNDVANKLLNKINISIDELDRYFSRNTKKTKVVEYDYELGKPNKEVIDETEEIQEFISIIDKNGLKQLTSALKDIKDVLSGYESEEIEDTTETDIDIYG